MTAFGTVFITANQAAELLRLHVRTIYRLARAGKIPAYKFGHEWRFIEQELMGG